METSVRASLVEHLVCLLTQAQAHATFEEATTGLPAGVWNQPVPAVPYTIWQLAEHVRIAQEDILDFSLDARHRSPEWPAGYWPAPAATADAATWQATLAQIRADRQRFIGLLRNPATDLLAPLPHGSGQTLLREALLVADHTAYHTGEIILVRRLLRAWK